MNDGSAAKRYTCFRQILVHNPLDRTLWRQARNTALEDGDVPVVIGDYGSSQGKNSLAPMRTAVKALRARLGPERPIVVVHIDQPANDFK